MVSYNLTLSFPAEINVAMGPLRGLGCPLKNRCDISSEVYATHLVGYNSLLQIIMAFWRNFFYLNLQGRLWQPAEDYGVLMAHFKFKKAC